MLVEMIHRNKRQVRELEVIDIAAVTLFNTLLYIVVDNGV